MTEILDRLEQAMLEVEQQLVAEFDRLRHMLSGEPYATIDPGIRAALDGVVIGLWHDLEHSGDRLNLSLRTDRHENLAMRMIVLKKLLDARIPTAYLAEVQEEAARVQRAEAARAGTMRREPQREDEASSEKDKKGLFGAIRNIFGGDDDEQVSSNRPHVTTNDEPAAASKERVNVYLDSGVYAATQQLASLAGRFKTAGDDKEMMEAAATGKAVFESHDLSARAPVAKEGNQRAQTPEDIKRKLAASGETRSGASSFESKELSSAQATARDLARTPDAIRKKLENAGPRQAGASSFESRELSGARPPEPATPRPPPKKPDTSSGEVAQTPEEIRKKLEARQAAAGAGGKASFGSKDIEPIAPQDVPPPRRKKVEETDEPAKPEEKPSGRAVFEARDLSTPPDKK